LNAHYIRTSSGLSRASCFTKLTGYDDFKLFKRNSFVFKLDMTRVGAKHHFQNVEYVEKTTFFQIMPVKSKEVFETSCTVCASVSVSFVCN